MIRGNPIRHTSQEMDNSSFDEELGVSMVEIIGADGVLKNPATEAKQDDTITAIQNITIPAPVGGATEAKQDTQIIAEQEIASALYSLRQILSLLADPMFLDPATSRVRVALESAAITMTGITTVGTVTTVTSMTNLAGYSAKDTLLNANEDLVWSNNIRSLIA